MGVKQNVGVGENMMVKGKGPIDTTVNREGHPGIDRQALEALN